MKSSYQKLKEREIKWFERYLNMRHVVHYILEKARTMPIEKIEETCYVALLLDNENGEKE